MVSFESNDSRNHFKVIYSNKLDYFFNIIKAGRVFKNSIPSLVTGGEDGVLRVHRCTISETSNHISGFESSSSKLETKAGPIQTLLLENLTNFNSIDAVVGDSRGMLTIFANNQILSRRNLLDNSISSILVERDAAGNMKIQLGSLDGTLLAVSPYETLSKQKLTDLLNEKQQVIGNTLEINCLGRLRIISGVTDINYMVVADNRNCLHFFQSGTLVRTVSVPSAVTCMCTGYFLPIDSSNQDSSASEFASPTKKTRVKSRVEDQIAVGTKDGRIFVISGFNCLPYANIGTRLTNIRAVKNSFDNCDELICTGNFNSVFIYRDSEEIACYTTADWIHTFDILNTGDGSKYLFIGCLDSKVEILSLDL